MPLRHIVCAIAAVTTGFVPTPSAQACTSMLLGAPGSTRLAYSYDFNIGAGLLLVNGRGAERRSILDTFPDSWVVRYGSVSFNQFGPGSPTTGMNEAGLVVTLMWNDEVEYPAANGRPAVTELEFIQRLLDHSGNVPEAIAEAGSVHVPGMVPIHYFVTDCAGRSAVLAFQDGELHVTEGPEIPALTNSDYELVL